MSLFLFVVPSKKVRVMKNCTALAFIYLRIHKQLILSKVRIIQNCNASPFKYLKMNKQLWLSEERIVKNCNASGLMYTRMKKPLLLSKEMWRIAVFKYVSKHSKEWQSLSMNKWLLLPQPQCWGSAVHQLWCRYNWTNNQQINGKDRVGEGAVSWSPWSVAVRCWHVGESEPRILCP